MAIPIAIAFFISPVTDAALFAAMLHKTPADMRGRVNNALLQVATGLAALSPLVAGFWSRTRRRTGPWGRSRLPYVFRPPLPSCSRGFVTPKPPTSPREPPCADTSSNQSIDERPRTSARKSLPLMGLGSSVGWFLT
jgi:hypothetical protein